MSLPDPLADLPRPRADPAGAQAAGERCWRLARDLGLAADALRSAVASGTGADVWVGQASATAADAGVRLATAYQVTADGATGAATALLICAEAWSRSQADYQRARLLADDAVREEAARAAARGTPAWRAEFGPSGPASWASPDRGRARAVARAATDDLNAASRACATSLERAAAGIAPRRPAQPPAVAPKHRGHVWDHGALGKIVHGGGHVLHEGADILKEAVTHPGHLLGDAAGVGLGLGLMLLGGAEAAGGELADDTVVLAPVGVALDLDGARRVAAGATVAAGFAVKGAHDIHDTVVRAEGHDAGQASGDPSPPEPGEVTEYGSRAEARAAFGGPQRPAANRFLKGATGKSTNFRREELPGGRTRISFFSPANNPGYGKLYVVELDQDGNRVAEYRDTLGPDGLIQRKWGQAGADG